MTATLEEKVSLRPSERWLVAVGFLVLAAINLMLWPIDYPPMIDLPNHLARHSIQCAGDSQEGLGRYYVYDFSWVPNLTAELVYLMPWACRSILTTQKLLIQFATTGLLAATVVLHYSVWRRWSVWPLMAVFGLHHMAFAYGFENFITAAPFILVVVALWFWLREASTLVRLAPMLPAVAGVYVFHLYAFIFLTGTLVFLEAQRWWRAPDRSGSGALGTAFLLTLVAAGPVFHLLTTAINSSGIHPGENDIGSLVRRLTTGLSPFTAYGLPYIDAVVLRVASFQVIALCAIWLGLRALKAGPILQPGTSLALAGMAAITFAFPAQLGGVFLTDIRFPVLLLCIAIGFSDIRLSRGQGMLLLAVIIGVAGARTTWLETRWSRHESEVRELLSAGRYLTPDDRVLVARTGRAWASLPHAHSASHLAREVGFFLPDLFSGGNSLSARDAYASRDAFAASPLDVALLTDEYDAPRDPSQDAVSRRTRYWAAWPEFYTHVLVLNDPEVAETDIDEFGQVVQRGSFFTLYEIAG